MTKLGELIERIVRGSSDTDIDFDELRRLLARRAFEERCRASHHIYRKAGV